MGVRCTLKNRTNSSAEYPAEILKYLDGDFFPPAGYCTVDNHAFNICSLLSINVTCSYMFNLRIIHSGKSLFESFQGGTGLRINKMVMFSCSESLVKRWSGVEALKMSLSCLLSPHFSSKLLWSTLWLCRRHSGLMFSREKAWLMLDNDTKYACGLLSTIKTMIIIAKS